MDCSNTQERRDSLPLEMIVVCVIVAQRLDFSQRAKGL